jgi:predicted ATPase/predicted Ser/Thr protein kinase
MTLHPGAALLHYRILEKIGQGGMGEVYKAEDLKLGRTVAIKVLSPEARGDDRARRRLLQEARAASALNHPNIVTVHAIEEIDGLDFLVMEYVEGESLAARLQRGPLDLGQVLDLGLQVADALALAHASGLIHRDIKSSNILLTPRGRAKVVDFGLAKVTGPVEALDTLTMALTGPGAIVGTVSYMSPEQTRGEPLDARSDLFSLGCVLYEAITGILPFRGPSVLAVLHLIATADAAPPGSLRAGLPPEFDRLLGRALAKSRDDRYASAADFAEALRAFERAAPAALEPEPEAFVGREPELQKLAALLGQAMQGSGRIVFLTGEPGIGKTALAAQFLRRARQQHPGLLIGRGRCVEQYGTGEAYLPFLDALTGLLAGPFRERVLALLRTHAPTWCLQFPAVFTSTGDVEQLQRETIGATKERMLRELGDALGALAASAPVVLLLEDLHWADPSSAALVHHLGRRAPEHRILLVGTFRPEDVELRDHPLKNYKREMLAHKLCEEIALSLLSREHVAGLLDARFHPNDFPAELALLIHRKTEGHALFATSLVQFLVERGDLARTNGRWSLARPPAAMDLEVPESVRSMIRKKIEALEEDDRRSLQYGSIEGEEFTSTLLAALLGVDEVALEERLDRLDKAHRLIRTVGEEELPDGSFATRYRFAHALYQNLFYADLVPKRRVLLHRQAGEELGRRYRDQASRIAGQLAAHFERGRDFARALDYRIQAGENATRLYDNVLAEEHYTTALELVAKLPEDQQARSRIRVLRKRGAARLAQARRDDAERDFQTMLEIARSVPDPEGECSALNALSNLYLYAHRIAEMEACASEARRIAEGIGNQPLQSEALTNLGLTHAVTGGLAEARAYYEQAIPLARSLNHQTALLPALTFRGVLHFFHSEYDSAEAVEQEAVSLASKARDSLYLALALFYLGLSRANRGRISEALAAFHEAFEMARRNGNQMVLSRVPNGLGWVYREIEDLGRAIEYNEACVETARRTSTAEAEANALINLVYDFTQAGNLTKARRTIDAVEAIFDRDPWNRWRFFDVRHQAGAAEFWLAYGRLDRAEEHARRLLANAARYGVPKYIAVSHKLLGDLAAARGENATAEEEFLAAVAPLASHPTPLVAWKLYASLGRLYARAGRPAAAREAFAQSAVVLRSIAGSVTDEALRANFLNTPAVREVLQGAEGG